MGGALFANIHTTVGTIAVRFFPDSPVRAVDSFAAHAGSYAGTSVFRVVDGLMIQAGDPLANVTVGDHVTAARGFDRAYLLALPSIGARALASQFLITAVAAPHLDGQHTILGEVAEGCDVVDCIVKTPVDRRNRPNIAISIDIVEISNSSAF
jgi:cyclophilin family peptidyl-prolyl cis-trans isomerase